MNKVIYSFSRRQALKIGLGSVLGLLIGPEVLAQSSKPANSVGAATQGAAKVDGVISYNAGWVISLEDKAPLLEIEARKNKEQEELAKQKAGKSSDTPTQVKDKPKSIADKLQGFVSKVKSYF